MSKPFANEIAFLNRKLFGTKVNWETRPALGQILTPVLPEAEAKNIVSKLRDALGKKAVLEFQKMVTSMASKLQGGSRVIITVSILREVFSDEIDGWGGGGGRGYNPLSTKPGPRGSGA